MDNQQQKEQKKSKKDETNKSITKAAFKDEGQQALSEQLQICQQQFAEWKENCLRVSADFDNYKKRIEREKKNWIKMAQTNVLYDLLAHIDDVDRALVEAEKKELTPDMQAWLDGFKMIGTSLHKFLDKFGVSQMTDYAIFNPEHHEALMHVDSEDHESGQIVEVLQKGYLFKDEVLRPAKVSVAK